MKKIKLTIQGIHCASCGTNIERSLRTVKGVKQATVSVMLNKGFVEAEDAVKDEDLNNAVKRAGYKVLQIEKE